MFAAVLVCDFVGFRLRHLLLWLLLLLLSFVGFGATMVSFNSVVLYCSCVYESLLYCLLD